MSQIKVFRVSGKYTKAFQKYVFAKEKRATKKEEAVEQVISEITSIGLFRRQIQITEVKELKKDEITNGLILQIMES